MAACTAENVDLLRNTIPVRWPFLGVGVAASSATVCCSELLAIHGLAIRRVVGF